MDILHPCEWSSMINKKVEGQICTVDINVKRNVHTSQFIVFRCLIVSMILNYQYYLPYAMPIYNVPRQSPAIICHTQTNVNHEDNEAHKNGRY